MRQRTLTAEHQVVAVGESGALAVRVWFLGWCHRFLLRTAITKRPLAGQVHTGLCCWLDLGGVLGGLLQVAHGISLGAGSERHGILYALALGARVGDGQILA